MTTSAIYQSQAPPGWTLADSTDSYRLWQRIAQTPPIAILAEEARPGRIFRCKRPKFRKLRQRAGGAGARLAAAHGDREAALLEGRRHARALGEGGVAADKSAPLDNHLAPGEAASQRSCCRPDAGSSSLQYVSPVTG